MLNAFRDNLKSLKWVLWFVAFAMVFFLGSYFVDNSGGRAGVWAARVDGDEISVREFNRSAQNMDNLYRQQFGESYSQLAPSLRVGTQAINQLINRKLILADAKKMGLRASRREIADQIVNAPSMQDAEGKFIGTEAYETLIKGSYAGGVKEFEGLIAEDIITSKWQSVVSKAVSVSEAELKNLYRERNEKTGIKYVVVPSSSQPTPADPTDEQLRQYYEENSSRYQRGAGRNIRYVVIDRQQVQDTLELSDEEIQSYYQANIGTYTRPPQRRARHILLRFEPDMDEAAKQAVRAEAESVLNRIRSGEDFATLATTLSADTLSAQEGGDLGFFGRGRMVPEFENAAFTTPVGELAPLTETQFGMHIIEVTEEREAGEIPLEEVRDQIRTQLIAETAQERIAAEAQRIRSEIRAADQIETVAETEGLEVESAFVSPGARLGNLGAGPDFADAVMATTVGFGGEPTPVAAGYAVFVVDEEVEAGVAPLTEVSERVQSDWLNNELRLAAVSAAESALANNDSVDAVADSLELSASESGDLTMRSTIPGTGGMTKAVRDALFDEMAVEGQIGVVEVPAGALVYEITSRSEFDEMEFLTQQAALESELRQTRENELYQALIERMRDDRDIQINTAEIDRVNGVSAG